MKFKVSGNDEIVSPERVFVNLGKKKATRWLPRKVYLKIEVKMKTKKRIHLIEYLKTEVKLKTAKLLPLKKNLKTEVQ